jgi:hypothetical protein
MFSTFFTAWGYEVSYLEFVASIASLIGVTLGITARELPGHGGRSVARSMESSFFSTTYLLVRLSKSSSSSPQFSVGLGGSQQVQNLAHFQESIELQQLLPYFLRR